MVLCVFLYKHQMLTHDKVIFHRWSLGSGAKSRTLKPDMLKYTVQPFTPKVDELECKSLQGPHRFCTFLALNLFELCASYQWYQCQTLDAWSQVEPGKVSRKSCEYTKCSHSFILELLAHSIYIVNSAGYVMLYRIQKESGSPTVLWKNDSHADNASYPVLAHVQRVSSSKTSSHTDIAKYHGRNAQELPKPSEQMFQSFDTTGDNIERKKPINFSSFE